MPTKPEAHKRTLAKMRKLYAEKKELELLDGLSPRIIRVIKAELHHEIGGQLELIKSIDAKLTVLISKVHNLGVDTNTTVTRSTQLVQALAELLEAPTQTQGEALAVVKDFLFNITRKKK